MKQTNFIAKRKILKHFNISRRPENIKYIDKTEEKMMEVSAEQSIVHRYLNFYYNLTKADMYEMLR